MHCSNVWEKVSYKKRKLCFRNQGSKNQKYDMWMPLCIYAQLLIGLILQGGQSLHVLF